jgi:hypothetical protein
MKLAARISVLVVTLALLGCGGANPRAEVAGKVTVAGKAPLPGGVIRFESVDTPSEVGSGTIDPAGAYVVSDAPVGECKVVIENAHLQPGGAGGGGGMERGIPQSARQKAPAMKSSIPKDADLSGEMTPHSGGTPKYVRIDTAYSSGATTPLKATVAKGSNSLDFDVK